MFKGTELIVVSPLVHVLWSWDAFWLAVESSLALETTIFWVSWIRG